MATLTDTPEFTSNEIYEIQATDPVEGAASGASFGGIGISNQPHQQLANRTALIRQAQLADEANIAALQAFTALFKGLMAQNGYVIFPFVDINRGLLSAVFQWGQLLQELAEDGVYTITWPRAFPNKCQIALAIPIHLDGTPRGGDLVMEVVSLSNNQGVFEANWTGVGGVDEDGFYWIAFGF